MSKRHHSSMVQNSTEVLSTIYDAMNERVERLGISRADALEELIGALMDGDFDYDASPTKKQKSVLVEERVESPSSDELVEFHKRDNDQDNDEEDEGVESDIDSPSSDELIEFYRWDNDHYDNDEEDEDFVPGTDESEDDESTIEEEEQLPQSP
jgi:hypothetical protein